MLKADLHVHSSASYDARGSVESILERASDVGLDVVAVTDHDSIAASLRAVELAPEHGVVAVPGAEVSTADGHLLAIGIDELPEVGRPIRETVERVRELGGIAVVPHPFQRTRHGAGAVEDSDAVETFNSRLFTGLANQRAKWFARRRGLPEVGGSDAHTVSMVGRAYTSIGTDDATPAGVIDGIRDGLTEVHGRRTPLRVSARQLAANGGRKVARSVVRAMGLF